MKEKKGFIQNIINFISSLISCTVNGLVLILFLLFVALTVKVIDRWNQPMLIPEAHGITYSELIHNRLDGWKYNQKEIGTSTLRCKTLWGSGIVISFPLQIAYTYVSYYPESKMVSLLDPIDVKNKFIPDPSSEIDIFSRWWWTFEKFSWAIMVEGVSNTPSNLCLLPKP